MNEAIQRCVFFIAFFNDPNDGIGQVIDEVLLNCNRTRTGTTTAVRG